jgi:hypothetical protein
VKNAAMLDHVPFSPRPLVLRRRVVEKEIGPTFRFQPKTDSERVIDFIEKGGFAPLQTSAFLHETEYVALRLC